MSENRLTIPIRVINAIAPDKAFFFLLFIFHKSRPAIAGFVNIREIFLAPRLEEALFPQARTSGRERS